MLLKQTDARARSRTAPTTGMRIAARMPMMAMTVSSSISVKARREERQGGRVCMSITLNRSFLTGQVHRFWLFFRSKGVLEAENTGENPSIVSVAAPDQASRRLKNLFF